MFDKRKVILPTPEEDTEINRGIAADPDTYELSDDEIKRLRPLREVMHERKRAGLPYIDLTTPSTVRAVPDGGPTPEESS